MVTRLNKNKFFIITGLALLTVILTGSMNLNEKVKIGDKVPLFSLLDQNGALFYVKDHIGKNSMVIYFYPKDDTPGCTKEACKFRDNYSEFENLKVKIIGISADDVESHKNFAKKYKLPFTLLADTDNKVRALFGVKNNVFGLIPGRTTYVINENGVVVHMYENMFKAENHVDEALKFLSH